MKLFVAATRQNDGKTMVSLGLIEALRRQFHKVGYMKPVGQQYQIVGGHKIDKDAILMKRIFNIEDNLSDMSPIAIPRGFTENYILRGRRSDLTSKLSAACRRLCRSNDAVVIEGTGHAGVGSIFDLSNAEVAKLLGARVVLVSGGGIGQPIDEIVLNKNMFDALGVKVVGVIINKVRPAKYAKVSRFVRLGLERKGIPVLGVLPYADLLSAPTLQELMEDLDGKLLCGKKGLRNRAGRMVIGAMPPHDALGYFSPHCLLITPGNREDLILTALRTSMIENGRQRAVSGIVLTCGLRPHPNIIPLIKQADVPIFIVPHDTFDTASKINRTVFKIRPEEKEKIAESGRLIEKHVDIDRLLEAVKTRKSC